MRGCFVCLKKIAGARENSDQEALVLHSEDLSPILSTEWCGPETKEKVDGGRGCFGAISHV